MQHIQSVSYFGILDEGKVYCSEKRNYYFYEGKRSFSIIFALQNNTYKVCFLLRQGAQEVTLCVRVSVCDIVEFLALSS